MIYSAYQVLFSFNCNTKPPTQACFRGWKRVTCHKHLRPLTEKAWEDAVQELGKYLSKANKTHLHEVIFVYLETVENIRFIPAS